MINIDNNRGNAMEYWIPSSRTWIIPSKPIHFEWDSPVVTPFFFEISHPVRKRTMVINGRINSPSFMDDDFIIDNENITRLWWQYALLVMFCLHLFLLHLSLPFLSQLGGVWRGTSVPKCGDRDPSRYGGFLGTPWWWMIYKGKSH